MLRSNQFIRGSQRSINCLRRPTWRAHGQRRFESSSSEGKTGNPFIDERQAVKEHAAKTVDLWRKLSLYVVPPALLISGLNAWNLWNEHWEHWEHMPPLEERPEYAYQNMRLKAYPWGDGDKTLFWNDAVNYHKKD